MREYCLTKGIRLTRHLLAHPAVPPRSRDARHRLQALGGVCPALTSPDRSSSAKSAIGHAGGSPDDSVQPPVAAES